MMWLLGFGGVALALWMWREADRLALHLAVAERYISDGIDEEEAMRRAGFEHWDMPWCRRMWMPYPPLPGEKRTSAPAVIEALYASVARGLKRSQLVSFSVVALGYFFGVTWFSPTWLGRCYLAWLAVGCGVELAQRDGVMPDRVRPMIRWVAQAHLWPRHIPRIVRRCRWRRGKDQRKQE